MSALKLGIALGGGAARGWAHIGVLRAAEAIEAGEEAVAGVGAAFAPLRASLQR